MKTAEIVELKEVVEKVELSVASFILRKIDKRHFDNGEFTSFNEYNKDRINKKLSKKSEKKLAGILAAGTELYSLVRTMDIKINSSAFHLLAYLRDLENGTKTLR